MNTTIEEIYSIMGNLYIQLILAQKEIEQLNQQIKQITEDKKE